MKQIWFCDDTFSRDSRHWITRKEYKDMIKREWKEIKKDRKEPDYDADNSPYACLLYTSPSPRD